MQRHILITGAVGAGKSTLIRRLLEGCTRPVYGFLTEKRAEDGAVYIHRAGTAERAYEDANRIGMAGRMAREINLEAFNAIGAGYLSAKPEGIIVMDELGFMESGAGEFKRAVLSALDGDIPVIAAVKARQGVAFLEEVRAHPEAELYCVTPENREALYCELIDKITGII